jgi:hypothetical protein
LALAAYAREQDTRRFVAKLLRHEFASEGGTKDRLAEVLDFAKGGLYSRR